MDRCFDPPVCRVLIAKADRLCAQTLNEAVRTTFPGAVRVIVRSLAEARSAFDRSGFDLVVAGVNFGDGEIFDLIEGLPSSRERRVLIVAARPTRSVVRRLSELPVVGIFDAAAEDPEDLMFALLNASLGLPCLSAALALEPWPVRTQRAAMRARPHAAPILATHDRGAW